MDDGQWTMGDHDGKHNNQTVHGGRRRRKTAVETNDDEKNY